MGRCIKLLWLSEEKKRVARAGAPLCLQTSVAAHLVAFSLSDVSGVTADEN